jgi:hypothetical protein
MRGSKTIPQAIVQQLHDRIYGTGLGPLKFNRVIEESISAFAVRISAVGRKMLLASGGREEKGHLLIPEQPVREQPLEWFDINDYAPMWNADWKMEHGSRGAQGSTYLERVTNTLVTYPRDTRPCRLERQLQVPTGKPILSLRVGSIPNEPWMLQILIDDDQVLRQIITSDAPEKEAQFQDLQVDLTKYAGQRVKLRLYHFLMTIRGPVAEGKVLGSAYWRSVDVYAT